MYMDMVQILPKFIKAERLGIWQLHLQALYDRLPYLAASGHNLYFKSVHLYLKKMFDLDEHMPNVLSHFMKGPHVVQRSDRLWAGISTDLAIEQCLIHSLKTRGGLTRGRGFTETQRLIWVLPSPACAKINNAMQSLTGITFTTSDQLKEASSARMSRDLSDVHHIMQYPMQRNPFSMNSPPSLQCIATGVVASLSVNCDESKSVAHQILQSMQGMKVANFTFRKKDQAITMGTKEAVKIRDEEIVVDALLLFQRLVSTGTSRDELQDIFNYPTALFESKSLM